ncbi:MAG TPA: SDR family oxidoreductase [Pirellulales bacterium]|nr:SDR family oxidoreductase [Pirellulales bacterium]
MTIAVDPLPHDRVAIVTGSGAARVGNSIARALASRGYRLALHAHRNIEGARKTADEVRATGADAIVLTGDLRDEDVVRTMVAQAYDHFGRIDALVNAAAAWERKKLEDVRAADVRLHLEINVLGSFLCCQQVGLRMVGQKQGGAIVNFGDWAIERPYEDYAAYFPSKGAIPAMTRSLAVELGRRNPKVRVNAILPGPVLFQPTTSPAEQAEAIAGTLAQRAGRPADVAQAVNLLLENEFITGACLPVDGGRTIFSGGT